MLFSITDFLLDQMPATLAIGLAVGAAILVGVVAFAA